MFTFTICSMQKALSVPKPSPIFMFQINLPNKKNNKVNVDVDYFKTSNSRFHNVLQCSGIAINFTRGYLSHYYIKKVCFFNVCGILLYKTQNQGLLSAESKLLSADFKLFLCRFLGGAIKVCLQVLEYYHICEQSSIKPFVVPEKAGCNLLICLQWCHLVALLSSGKSRHYVSRMCGCFFKLYIMSPAVL